MALQSGMTNAASVEDSLSKRRELDQLNTSVQEFIDRQIEENQDNFFGTFVLALQEVSVPDPPRGEDGKPIDPAFQYKYYKSHKMQKSLGQ